MVEGSRRFVGSGHTRISRMMPNTSLECSNNRVRVCCCCKIRNPSCNCNYATMCNIPLWRTENTYYLRTLARKWSGPFLTLDLLYLIMMWLTDDMMCYYFIRRVLLTQFDWVCRVFDLEDAEASVEPPLDSGLSQGVCFWVDMFTMMFHLIWWFDVTFWHDCWWCRLTIACQPDSHME